MVLLILGEVQAEVEAVGMVCWFCCFLFLSSSVTIFGICGILGFFGLLVLLLFAPFFKCDSCWDLWDFGIL